MICKVLGAFGVLMALMLTVGCGGGRPVQLGREVPEAGGGRGGGGGGRGGGGVGGDGGGGGGGGGGGEGFVGANGHVIISTPVQGFQMGGAAGTALVHDSSCTRL